MARWICTFFEIDNFQVTLTSDHITHRDVQSLSRWLNRGPSRVVTIHLYTADQFGGHGIDNLDSTVGVSGPGDDSHVI